jgi:hypothetical protein
MAHVLRGIQGIVNAERVDGSVDPEQVAQTFLGGGAPSEAEDEDRLDHFTQQLRQMRQHYGLANAADVASAAGDVEEAAPPSVHSAAPSERGGVEPYRPPPSQPDPVFQHYTDEQLHRAQTDNVLRAIEPARIHASSSAGLSTVRDADEKNIKLERITQICQILKEDSKTDLADIPDLTSRSPMEEIDAVLRRLELRLGRTRYASIAEEVIVGVAGLIEDTFDGERTLPVVGWAPDYTGYSRNVRVKMRRLRPVTSDVVRDAIESVNPSAFTRIMIELLPSFLMYPHSNRAKGTQGAYSEVHMQDAIKDVSEI